MMAGVPGSHDAFPPLNTSMLRLLLESADWLTVEALTLRLKLERREVNSQFDLLRRHGCRCEAHPQLGLRLLETGLGVWSDYLSHRGAGERAVSVWQRVTSTQDVCRTLMQQRGHWRGGEVVIAHEQTAGRGRLGRRWITPPGAAVTFSRVCAGDNASGRSSRSADRFTLGACVAVARALDVLLTPCGLRTGIKWPNDLYVNDRKIAGILVETACDGAGASGAIVGVGVNVALRPEQMPPPLQSAATSLAMCGVTVDRLRVLALLLDALDDALDHSDPAELVKQWRTRSLMLHQRARFAHHGIVYEGEVVDLDPEHGIIVRRHDGQLLHLPAATTSVLERAAGADVSA